MAENHHDPTKPFNIVGKPTPLLDSRSKVTGEAIYTDDLSFPNMLVGKLLRSPRPHARIKSIDLSAALALPGVVAIVVGSEAPAKFGVLPISRDETALAVEKVKYVGDIVAGVAAETELQAVAACHAIRIEWEDLPSHQRMEKCLEPHGEPVHPDRSRDGSNLHKGVDQEFGDVESALADAAFKVSGTFEFPGINHGFTEPHCAIAKYDGGRLTLWTAQQVPHYLHRSLADVMEMPMHRITVIRPMVGGGFGGKSDPFPHEMVAALLARKTGRPVKILFDREEVFLTNHGRHPGKNTMTLALDADLNISLLDSRALIEGGAWASFGVVTTYYNGVLSMGPYKIPSFRYSGRRVYSNKPPHGAMRGHGSVNARMALECLLDELAEQAGVDPCDLRLKNALEPYSFTVNDLRVTSMGLPECIARVRAASGWDQKFRQLPYGRGIGLGCGMYISGSAKPIHRTRMPQSTVHLKIDMDGGVTIHSLAAEIGQGSDTMLAQCVAEVLGLGLDWMRVYSRSTDTAPIDLGSYSSRVTFMAGNAARKAAIDIKRQLQAAASRITGYEAEVFECQDAHLVCQVRPEVRVPYLQAVDEAIAYTGALIARGQYETPPMGGTFKGAAAGTAPSYSYQAFIAEVEVDPETGFVRLEHIWAAHDVGRALNPLAVEGQIIGSIHMGLGQVLSEAMRYNHKVTDGNLLNGNLLDYKIPGPLEMPPVDVFIVESNDPEGPFGAKECGEGALAPILPAVINAIYDAVGIRLRTLPVTPDVVLEAIQRKEANKPAHAFTPLSFAPANVG